MRTPEEIVPAFEAVNRAQAQAMYVIDSPSFFTHRTTLLGLAAKARLAVISGERPYAEEGGLMSYGPSYEDQMGRSAQYVDKILKGAKPSGLPIEQPAKFTLIVNLKAARLLGITISESNLTVQQRRFACCWPAGYRRRSADSNGKLQLLKNAIVLNARPDPEPGDVLILQKVEGTISEGHAGGPDAVAIVNR